MPLLGTSVLVHTYSVQYVVLHPGHRPDRPAVAGASLQLRCYVLYDYVLTRDEQLHPYIPMWQSVRRKSSLSTPAAGPLKLLLYSYETVSEAKEKRSLER